MLVSGRQAAKMLAEIGLARRQARIVLDVGLAGEPIRTPAQTLYDSARVAQLTARPPIDRHTALRWCPRGLLLDRRASELTEQRVEVPLTVWTRLEVWAALARCERYPYLATMGGFVVRGAEIVAVGNPHRPGS